MHQVTLKRATGTLAEAYTGGVPQMSLLDENGTAYHEPVHCKDFITDLFWSEYTRQPSTAYGFTWTPGTISLTLSWYYIAISYVADLASNALALQKFLNQIESAMNIQQSTVLITQDPSILVIKFHRAWTEAPYLISAFTQYVRCGLSYTEGDVIQHLESGPMLCSFDKRRMREVAARTRRIIIRGTKLLQTYQQYETTMGAHTLGGLLGWDGLKPTTTEKSLDK